MVQTTACEPDEKVTGFLSGRTIEQLNRRTGIGQGGAGAGIGLGLLETSVRSLNPSLVYLKCWALQIRDK